MGIAQIHCADNRLRDVPLHSTVSTTIVLISLWLYVMTNLPFVLTDKLSISSPNVSLAGYCYPSYVLAAIAMVNHHTVFGEVVGTYHL